MLATLALMGTLQTTPLGTPLLDFSRAEEPVVRSAALVTTRRGLRYEISLVSRLASGEVERIATESGWSRLKDGTWKIGTPSGSATLRISRDELRIWTGEVESAGTKRLDLTGSLGGLRVAGLNESLFPTLVLRAADRGDADSRIAKSPAFVTEPGDEGDTPFGNWFGRRIYDRKVGVASLVGLEVAPSPDAALARRSGTFLLASVVQAP